MSEPILLRLPEAAERLAISRSKAYALARAGELPGLVKLGSSWRVSTKALDEWIAQHAAG